MFDISNSSRNGLVVRVQVKLLEQNDRYTLAPETVICDALRYAVLFEQSDSTTL